MHPQPIKKSIDKLARLPSVGPKSAERMIYYLLQAPPQELRELAQSLGELQNNISQCSGCGNFSETNPCEICSDSRRDCRILCLVTKPQDIVVLEKTHAFNGLYLILNFNLHPLEMTPAENILVRKLLDRIKTENISEVILAFNPDMNGETASIFLSGLLKKIEGLKISRLARGLPSGADVEYADELTLESALKNRQNIS